MNDKLIEKLSKLRLEESNIRRNLDKYYCDSRMKARLFARLKKIKTEIDKTKFKLQLERKIKNENSNTD